MVMPAKLILVPRDEPRCPAEVFHVIDFIYEEIEARGWDMWQLAVRMCPDPVTEETVLRIKLSLEFLETKSPGLIVGEESAEQLARAFGTGKQIWLNLDKTWQQHNPYRGDVRASD